MFVVLHKEVIDFLLKFEEPVLRKLLSTEEKALANDLFKEGLLEKGKSDDKHKSVIYYLDSSMKTQLIGK